MDAKTVVGTNGHTGEKIGIDGLTGVWNRAGFVAAATPMLLSCQRREAPVALGYFDVLAPHAPHAPRVSGDRTIDRVLMAVAQQMRKTFRDCDIIGRVDTLRFAVLFADCTDEALAAAEGVRAVTDTSKSPKGLTLAVGLVQGSRDGTLGDLMREADERAQDIKDDQADA
jgi:diguanylate cyclase (GGDEF)-like protein